MAQIAIVIYASIGGVDGIGIPGIRIGAPADFIRQQGEFGHSGGQVQLEFGPGATEVPGLTDPQLRVVSGRGQDRTLRGMASVECAIDGWS